MAKANIHRLLSGKWEDGTRPADVFSMYVSKNPKDYVGDLIGGLESDSRRVQSGCAVAASLLSEKEPALLYAYLETFQENLTAREPVLRWEAVCTLGNLARVDKDERIRENVEQIASYLGDKSIVLQVHSVRALAKIAQAFPDLSLRVVERLIRSKDKFPGNRVGFVIEAMIPFATNEDLAPKILKFVEPYARSDIEAVAAKARKVLKNIAR